MVREMNLVVELKSHFEAEPDVSLAILFGSAARGVSAPGSDIDIAVAMKDGPLGSSEKQRLLEALGERFGRPVDIVDLRTQRGRLAAGIMRSGLPLVVRDSALLGRLMRDSVMWREDMAPNWRYIQRRKLERMVHGR